MDRLTIVCQVNWQKASWIWSQAMQIPYLPMKTNVSVQFATPIKFLWPLPFLFYSLFWVLHCRYIQKSPLTFKRKCSFYSECLVKKELKEKKKKQNNLTFKNTDLGIRPLKLCYSILRWLGGHLRKVLI